MPLPRVYATPALDDAIPDLNTFADQFKRYKAGIILPPRTFGKDVPYSEAGAAKDSELWHMHLAVDALLKKTIPNAAPATAILFIAVASLIRMFTSFWQFLSLTDMR